MNFARRVFFWSGIYGIAVLLPMLFLERWMGEWFPPATNRPEQYYGFLALALVWQFAFLLISRDVDRYRPLMLVAVAEKWLAAGIALGLYGAGRFDGALLGPTVIDLLLGGLFVVAYVRTRAISQV